jgi:hypothetical protein
MNMTVSLAQFLREKNAETEAWVAEDPDNRWAGLLIEDLDHWAEMGITTVEQYRRYDLESLIWDMYKDATGIRPRHLDFKSMTDAELQDLVNYLGREIEADIAREAEWDRLESEWEAERAAEEDARRAEDPEPIDYVAANYQEGWL